jgi:hypothetical protein
MGQLNDRVDDVVVVVGLVKRYVSELDYVFHSVTGRRHIPSPLVLGLLLPS